MHTANRSGQGGGPEAVGSGLKPGPREVQVRGVYPRTEPQTGATYCGLARGSVTVSAAPGPTLSHLTDGNTEA